MNPKKIALLSRHIVCEKFPEPISGVVLIKDELIEEVLTSHQLNMEAIAQEYIVEDLGNLYVFPGLVDLNVSFAGDGASTVTKQAISGGVTTVATIDTASGDLYCDIARLGLLANNTEASQLNKASIFACKAFLVPQGPGSQILSDFAHGFKLCEGLPLFIHPELATPENLSQATPYRQVEPERRAFDCKIVINDGRGIMASEFKLESDDEDCVEEEEYENSESCSEDAPEITINDFSGEEDNENTIVEQVDSMRLMVPEREKKRVSLPTLLSGQLLIPATHSPRHHSVQCPGINSRPIPLQDIPFIQRGIHVEQAYKDHISKFPPDWEIAAISKILSENPSSPVHFSNVSSSEALSLISLNKKQGKNITSESSLPYIYFSESDVKPGDTRYKLNPPIRDHANYMNLWQLLKSKEIDCVSSYHQPVPPPSKFIGDFTRAVNGVMSVGFSLQGLWTRLRAQVPVEEEEKFLVLASWLTATRPAEVLKLTKKGGIAKGKYADLVVWDPDTKFKISSTFDRFPEMSPYIGEELYGVVHRTYLRGQLVFSSNGSRADGKILRPG